MQQQSRATEQRVGNRKSLGKRKLSDHEREEPQQRTISELLSKSNSISSHSRDPQLLSSPFSTKRFREASLSSPLSNKSQDTLISPDKMYNFSNSENRATGGFGQKAPGYAAAPRPSPFAPHTGAKKLVVKNLRSGPRLNQDTYFEKVWGQLEAALEAIFDHGKPASSLEELYKGAENVCRQGRASLLAKKLQERCKHYVSGNLREILEAKAQEGSNIDTLRAVVDAWILWNSKLVSPRPSQMHACHCS
jgi:hypothetical protein